LATGEAANSADGDSTNGGMHRSNSFNQNNRAAPRGVVHCQLCDVACTGRDAYAAHLRGSKHLKTLKLHQKLNKPIPPDLLLPANQPTSAPHVSTEVSGSQMMPGQASISAPQVNYIAGVSIAKTNVDATTASQNATQPTPLFDLKPQVPAALNTQSQGSIPQLMSAPIKFPQKQPDNLDENDEEEYSCEPVGKEYIETRVTGKIVSFYCKLCDCQFNDPNAKEMHTKGKRHRLAYKVNNNFELIQFE
jgi:zinc finger RNA-binding protein